MSGLIGLRLSFVLLLLFALHAAGEIIVYTDQTSFFAATDSLSLENFENTSPGRTGTSRVLSNFILTPIFTEQIGYDPLEIINDPASAVSGVQSAGGQVRGINLVFADFISAFAFNVNDFGDESSTDPLILRLRQFGTVFSTGLLVPAGAPFEQVRFLGVTSTIPFNGVEIFKLTPEFMTFDDVYTGFVIPEPSTLSLLTVAFCGFALGRRLSRLRGARLTITGNSNNSQ
jgi:hypothetical protein